MGEKKNESNFEVIGVSSSPYTAKMRAVLRFRRIPFIWRCTYPQFDPDFAYLNPTLMPVVFFPDGKARDDSTPIILELESVAPGYRSVRPADPVLDLYSLLIEDMADEFLTKILYHYRFDAEADRSFATNWVMDDTYSALTNTELRAKAYAFLGRQLSRAGLVGATKENAAVFQRAFALLIEALDPMVARDAFLFGSRPSLGDFGLFGQLDTLCSDPTPSAMIRARAPRIEYWTRRMQDLSGVEGSWQQSDQPSPSVLALLRMAGTSYLPLLSANSEAYRNEEESYEVKVDGGTLQHPTFRYHAKCYRALRDAYSRLSDDDRKRAAPVLRETGCLRFLDEPQRATER